MSAKTSFPTQFAPAERTDAETLTRQATYFAELNLLDTLLNAVQDSVVVLNQERQIVYTNTIFLEAIGADAPGSILGLRPGEAFRCAHASETPGGCGTTENCRHCGALLATLAAQAGRKNTQECRITVEHEAETQALDLRVSATPFIFDDEQFIIFAATDISNEKRRSILERIFFHDITNTAGVIYGLVGLLAETEDMAELSAFGFNDMLSQASTRLIDEIQAQQQIMTAERGELVADPGHFHTWNFLNNLVLMYRRHHVAEGKTLVIAPRIADILIETDEALLGRVIGNMIKNALEASAPGETVTVGCEQIYDYVRFWIHNPQSMPAKVRLQVFQRSYSTKGKGRGLGTYSMKLLSENYLQGRVSFVSDPDRGTTFMGMYPIKWPRGLPEQEQARNED